MYVFILFMHLLDIILAAFTPKEILKMTIMEVKEICIFYVYLNKEKKKRKM